MNLDSGSDCADHFEHLLAGKERPHEDVLDEVYSKYAHSNPFLPVIHFVDHATMGAEAMVGLKLGIRVKDWIAHQKVRPYDPPMAHVDVKTQWQDILGKPEYHGDWIRFFENELSFKTYPAVLNEWVPKFAHDIGVYLFHGLIRTAHASRSLDYKDTSLRRGELARGLALWAIGIKNRPVVWSEVVDLANSGNEILTLARAGAAAFIHEPTIPKLHLVTSVMAYMMIVPHLDEEVHQVALHSFHQTHATALENLGRLSEAAALAPIPSLSTEEIDELALIHNPHPAKLTEAALRAYSMTGDELFLRAAGRAQHLSIFRGVIGGLKASIFAKGDHSHDMSL